MASELIVPNVHVTTKLSAVSIQSPIITVSALEVSGDGHIEGNLVVDGVFDAGAVQGGELYITATVAVSASATYIELLSVATSQSSLQTNFSVTAGSLKFDGAEGPRNFLAIAQIGVAASGAATETFLTFGVDGSALARLEIAKELGTSDDEIFIHGLLKLAVGERVSIMLKGDEGAAAGWKIREAVLTVKE